MRTLALPALRAELQALQADLDDSAHPICAGQQHPAALPLSRDILRADLEQIAAALTLERARYYLERLIRGITAARSNGDNDINLNRWKEYGDIHTDSLWMIERRDSSGVHTADYWGNFVPQIPNQMLRRYTRPGDWVIDPFAGSGTTLIEAQRLGRNALGIELQPRMVARIQAAVATEPNPHHTQCVAVQGNSATIDVRALLGDLQVREAQLAVLHPPYFDIIRFSDDADDLSNAPSVDAFLALMGQVVDNLTPALARGRYLVLVIGDKYMRGDWIPLGFLTMNEVQQRGFRLKSIVVKNFEQTVGKRQQKELWRYRALAGGFFVFKHEYLFCFSETLREFRSQNSEVQWNHCVYCVGFELHGFLPS
ncbi:site-specific DNA-methyltransferase [Candidatus Gracilibacteria bacterium]|nr:site-specific DNA-methyltransferase [Candidatus Gracilibacteria bacterium]